MPSSPLPRMFAVQVAALLLVSVVACQGARSEPPPAQVPDAEPWLLTFEQSGGFVGWHFEATIRSSGDVSFSDRGTARTVSAPLSGQALKELNGVLTSADLPRSQGQYTEPRCRDCFRYLVALTRGGFTYRLDTDDAAMPANVQPLIEWLSQKTREAF